MEPEKQLPDPSGHQESEGLVPKLEPELPQEPEHHAPEGGSDSTQNPENFYHDNGNAKEGEEESQEASRKRKPEDDLDDTNVKKQKEEGPPEANLFVGSLTPEINEQSLLALFQPYGKVLHAKVMYDQHSKLSRGFGFVRYEDPAAGTSKVEIDR